ncbi:heterokaryon incompatibility protein-domain-containing protein [Xylariomycetidae sp. FL2044]|nr:heterokaryon incompatibility protein-domain-containing protein [Xylariomycetidae sp. FL2044]
MVLYTPLVQAEREFRLVRINPPTAADEDSSSTIDLTLERFSLNNAPPYSALSYVWGEGENPQSVLVNGDRTALRKNLHEALVSIRAHGVKSWFWIDAVSINQDDVEERSWQVDEMRAIYSQAASVYIWLGPEADDSQVAMRLLESVSKEISELEKAEHANWRSDYRQTTHERQSESKHFFLRMGEISGMKLPSTLKALASLLDRDYFCRVWVIQEVSLAKDGYVLCGRECLSLSAFDKAVYGISLYPFYAEKPLFDARGVRFFFPGTLFHIKPLEVRRRISTEFPMSLWEILKVDYAAPGRAVCRASDPRDMIFGVLGCAADAKLLNIKADYSKPFPEVFAEATKALLLYKKEYVLGYCVFPKPTKGLPSWVPDWVDRGVHGVREYPITYEVAFKASKDLKQPRDSIANAPWNVLPLMGCRVEDVIAVMTPPRRWANRIPQIRNRRAWLDSVIQFCGLGPAPIGDEDPIWCSIVNDTIQLKKRHQRSKAERRSQRSTAEWRSLAPLMFRGHNMRLEDLSPAQTELVCQLGEGMGIEELCEKSMSWAASSCRARTLFRTRTGRVCAGPREMKVGDLVTILWRSDAPIVLRDEGDGYHSYVGEAYVHGIMDGEFLDGKPETEVFNLI